MYARKLTKSDLLKIAKEIYRTKKPAELAKEIDCSETTVGNAAGMMRRLGMDIPYKPRIGYKSMATELMNEFPELVKGEKRRERGGGTSLVKFCSFIRYCCGQRATVYVGKQADHRGLSLVGWRYSRRDRRSCPTRPKEGTTLFRSLAQRGKVVDKSSLTKNFDRVELSNELNRFTKKSNQH